MTALAIILAIAVLLLAIAVLYLGVRHGQLADQLAIAEGHEKDAVRDLGTMTADRDQQAKLALATRAQVVTLTQRLARAQAAQVAGESDEDLIDEINHPGDAGALGDDRDKLLPFPHGRAAGTQPAPAGAGVPGGPAPDPAA